jgi:hypothetical protein
VRRGKEYEPKFASWNQVERWLGRVEAAARGLKFPDSSDGRTTVGRYTFRIVRPPQSRQEVLNNSIAVAAITFAAIEIASSPAVAALTDPPRRSRRSYCRWPCPVVARTMVVCARDPKGETKCPL